MTAFKGPEISKEAMVTSIGVLVLQLLEFYSSQLDTSERDIQKLWSPFLAATTRMIKPADDMVDVFKYSPKEERVRSAVKSEIQAPEDLFYESFNQSVQGFLKMIAESVGEFSYLIAIESRGAISKPQMAQELTGMLNFYFDDQNQKGRKRQNEDASFITLVSTAIPQHVEDTMMSTKLNGLENTGKIVQLGQAIFATAILLQITKGMV